MSDDLVRFKGGGIFGVIKNPVIGVLALSNLSVMLGFGQILPLIPVLLVDQLNATALEVSATVAAFAVTRIFFQGPIGALSDRYGRKPFVTLPLLGYTVVSVLYIFANATWMIIAIRGLQGIFSASLWPVSDAIVMDVVDPKYRARAVTSIQIAYSTGSVSGPFLGGVIAGIWGLWAVFASTALMTFVALIFSLIFLKETAPIKLAGRANGGVPDVRPRSLSPVKDTRDVLRRFPVLRKLAYSALIWQSAPSLTMIFMPVYVTDVLGGTEFDVGVLMGIVGVLTMVTQYAAGVIGDRHGKWRVLHYSSLIGLATSPLLFFVTSRPTAYLLYPISMAAMGLGQPMMTALVGDALPMSERGVGYGAYGVIRDVSMVIGAFLSGSAIQVLSDTMGIDVGQGVHYVFLIRVFVIAFAAYYVWRNLKAFKEVDTVVWMRQGVPASSPGTAPQ